jgi:hypothetical protein
VSNVSIVEKQTVLDVFIRMNEEKPVMIRARKTNFLQYFSYFESEKLRKDLLDRIENKRSNRLEEAMKDAT